MNKKRCTIAQAVSRQPVTAEAQVCTQVNPYQNCGGQSDTGTGFLRVFQFFSVTIVLPWLSMLTYDHLGDEQQACW
jgi:hypothetical protein